MLKGTPTGKGATCENLDWDAYVIFGGLKLAIRYFLGVAGNWRYFFGFGKINVIF